jgi:amidase
VPFLIKDFLGHEAGRRIDFGSRLCRGLVSQQDSHLCEMFKAGGSEHPRPVGGAGVFDVGHEPESALHGNTSTPWKRGYSAGGSTGGGMAAVAAGMVPIAARIRQSPDRFACRRATAAVSGLKPSRGRVSLGPMQDENGYGLGQNFVQSQERARHCRHARLRLHAAGRRSVAHPAPR